MSKSVPPRPHAAAAKRRFAIVASQFNAQYVQGLVDHAEKELRSLASNTTIFIHRVPGSFEILAHAVHVDHHPAHDAREAAQHVIEGDETVG